MAKTKSKGTKLAVDSPYAKKTMKEKVTPAKGESCNDLHLRMLSQSACSKECVSPFNVNCDLRFDIPCEANWQDCFPLKSVVELVASWGLSPESVSSRLASPIGGRLVNNMNS